MKPLIALISIPLVLVIDFAFLEPKWKWVQSWADWTGRVLWDDR